MMIDLMCIINGRMYWNCIWLYRPLEIESMRDWEFIGVLGLSDRSCLHLFLVVWICFGTCLISDSFGIDYTGVRHWVVNCR